MFKKGAAITIIFIISTAIQLISQIVITRIFGASFELDTFLAAVAIPTILVTVIYATFNDAFLPLFGEYKAKNPEHADQYFFSHVLTLTFIFTLVGVVGMFLSQSLSTLLYSGRDEVFIAQVSVAMRYLLLGVPLAAVSGLLGSYLYAQKQFIRFPLAQLAGNGVNLILVMFLSGILGIWALVAGFIVSIIVQILFVIPKNLKNIDFRFTPVSGFIVAWVPLVIGALALRSDTLLIRSFGTQLPQGYLVYLNLISKIFSLATGVLTIGIQVLLLPHLVEYLAEKKYHETIAYVMKAKLVAIGLAAGTTILLALLAPVAIHILFVGGKFTPEDADIATTLIPYFVVPAIGWGINSVFFQPLIALKKQKQLGLLNVSALILALGTAYVANQLFNPLAAIISGLTVLLFTGIIGAELLWQKYKKQLLS